MLHRREGICRSLEPRIYKKIFFPLAQETDVRISELLNKITEYYRIIEISTNKGLLGRHQFDLFCTSTQRLYFALNFTSTFMSQLHFDLFGQTVLRPKLYFDLCFQTNKKSRFGKRSKYRVRSTRVEVKRTKQRGRSRAVDVQKRPNI